MNNSFAEHQMDSESAQSAWRGSRVSNRLEEIPGTTLIQGIVLIFFAALFLLGFLFPIVAKTFASRFGWACFTASLLIAIPTIFPMLRVAKLPWRNWAMAGLWLAVIGMNLALERGGTQSATFHLICTISTLMAAVLGTVVGIASPWVRHGLMATILIALGLQALVSLPTLYGEYGIARELMAYGRNALYFDQLYYALRGVGDFHLYTGIAILTPVLLGTVLSSSLRLRWILSACLVAVLGSILLSTFSAAVALAIFGMFTLVGGIVSRRGFAGMIATYAVITGVIAAIFLTLGGMGELKQIESVTAKLQRLFEGVTTHGVIEGDETTRGHLAAASFKTFLEEPAFGVGAVTMWGDHPLLYDKVGGHCSWLDQLAEYGLIGFGPFLIFLTQLFRSTIGGWFRHRTIWKASVCVMIGSFVIQGFVNPAIFVDSVAVPVVFILSMVAAEAANSDLRSTPSVLPSRRSEHA